MKELTAALSYDADKPAKDAKPAKKKAAKKKAAKKKQPTKKKTLARKKAATKKTPKKAAKKDTKKSTKKATKKAPAKKAPAKKTAPKGPRQPFLQGPWSQDIADADVFRSLAMNLKDARNAAGMSQGALAEVIGCSRIAIVNLEGAKNGATLTTLLCLCSTLNVTPGTLLAYRKGE